MVMRGEFGGTRRSGRVLRKNSFLSTAVLMEAGFISAIFWSWKESSEKARLRPGRRCILPINSLCCVTEVSGDHCSETNPTTSQGSRRRRRPHCGQFWWRVNEPNLLTQAHLSWLPLMLMSQFQD